MNRERLRERLDEALPGLLVRSFNNGAIEISVESPDGNIQVASVWPQSSTEVRVAPAGGDLAAAPVLRSEDEVFAATLGAAARGLNDALAFHRRQTALLLEAKTRLEHLVTAED